MEAVYFPAIGLLIGLSTLITIYIGSLYQLEHKISAGTIAEFVIYINMLTFPVSAIGWTASMIQRAAASQKRLNEFLSIVPVISTKNTSIVPPLEGNIEFNNVGFVYPHSGIHALNNFDLKEKDQTAEAAQSPLLTTIRPHYTRMFEAVSYYLTF